jgi:TonB-dependent starch-binding outer membrane protein SusC
MLYFNFELLQIFYLYLRFTKLLLNFKISFMSKFHPKTRVLLLALLFLCQMGFSQVSIKGKVTAADDNSPVPGTTVTVKGTTNGVVADANGNYSISTKSNSMLIFSAIGYETIEINVGNQTTVNVSLNSGTSKLDEVVVVGYGTVKKASLTAAVASVSAKEIADLPVVSIQNALQGRVSGVQVTSVGSPGVEPIVRVRGVGSINYAANPLYVVDGIPLGGLNDISNADIESVDVLKDASSAAIYGSRAANGVIMITTKKGSAKRDGKIHVNLDTYYGTQSAWKTLDILDRDQYLQYGRALLGNAGNAQPDRWKNLGAETYTGSGSSFNQTSTDMQDYLFRKAPIGQTTVSINSSNEKSKFYASISNFMQEGIYVGTNFSRNSLRFNSEHQISKRFTFGQNFMLSYSKKLDEGSGGGRSQLANAIKWVPYLPPLNPTEIGGYYGPTNADGSDPENPLYVAYLRRNRGSTTRMIASAYVGAKITDWLSYKFTAAADLSFGKSVNRTPIYTAGQFGSTLNQLSDTRGNGSGQLYTNQLTFDKTFGKHYVNVIAVAEQQYGGYDFISSQGSYATNQFDIITPNITKQAVSGGKDERVILSYLSRVNYDYSGKYLFSASIRRDGSSLFAPGKKWGTFPAASVGWRISEENFMKDIPAISELKLRGSYGLVGNISNLPNYAWQSVIGASTNYQFGGGLQGGQSTNQLGNADLGWELTKMTDVGLDLSLFKNKFEISLDYYIRETADNSLILARGLPSSLGYSNPTIANFGAMKNTGLDLQLSYNNRVGDLKYNLTGNFSTLKNEVVFIEAPLNSGQHGETGNPATRTEAGMPVQYLYGFVVDRIYQNATEIAADEEAAKKKGHASYQGGKAAPGDIRFKDIDGDGQVNDNDRTMIGNVLPKFTYGFNANLAYKNFDLTLFGQGVYGNDIYNNLKYPLEGMTRLFGSSVNVLNAWTPTNTNTDIPRAINQDPNGNATRASDRFVEKGSYFRIKNVALGYNLANKFLSKLTNGTISTGRIYVSAQNLLTITKYSGYDPEIGARDNNQLVYGIDDGQFPQARTFLAGLQLGF